MQSSLSSKLCDFRDLEEQGLRLSLIIYIKRNQTSGILHAFATCAREVVDTAKERQAGKEERKEHGIDISRSTSEVVEVVHILTKLHVVIRGGNVLICIGGQAFGIALLESQVVHLLIIRLFVPLQGAVVSFLLVIR